MAKSETSYIDAATYAGGLNEHLKQHCGCYVANKWAAISGSGSSWSVENTYATKQGLINSFSVSPVWDFTKHASNPLVAKSYNGGANHEYYPTCIAKVGNDYRCMAKNNGEGWAYSGTDGVSWSEDGKYLSKGTAGQWDDGKASPGVLRYVGSTFHMCYNGYNDEDFIHKVGYASTNSWGAFTKDSSVRYGPSDYNAANGTSYTDLVITDVLLIGTTYYYYGIVFNSATYDEAVFCYGKGQAGGNFKDYKVDTKAFSTTTYFFDWGQFPNVWKHPDTGEWIMTATLGRLIQDTSKTNQAIYNFYSGRTDEPIFKGGRLVVAPILKPNTANAFEDNYNYCPSWHKNNDGTLIAVDGKYRLYFSTHEAGVSYDYTGAMCLAEITTIPQL